MRVALGADVAPVTPASGNGKWKQGSNQSVKDRWVFLLRRDATREAILSLKDAPLSERYPWAEYREPKWKRNKPKQGTGGGDWRRWSAAGS